MKIINNNSDYEKANKRIEQLLLFVGNETQETDKNFIELNNLSDSVANYEEKYYSMQPESLIEMVQLRMYQRELKKNDLAKLLNTTPSQISEFLNGKLRLSFLLAKDLYNKLNIDPEYIFNS